MDQTSIHRKPIAMTASDQRRESAREGAEIQRRIRSLLASPNDRSPLMTPSSTPAGAHPAANYDDEEVGFPSGRVIRSGLDRTKLPSIPATDLSLDAYNFDGPAGPVADAGTDGPRRRSVQRGIDSHLGGGAGQPTSASQRGSPSSAFSPSRRSLKDSAKKPDVDEPRRVKSTVFKKNTNPRRSLYNLKATSSAGPSPAEKRSKDLVEDPKFRINHVPGSFRSEYDADIQGSESASPISWDEEAPVTVEPLPARSFETVSSREASLNDAILLHQNPSQLSAVSPDTEENKNNDVPNTVVPFLRPTLSSYTIHETPSNAAPQADPAPQRMSLESVIDRFEGQPPDSELVQAIEGSSKQALTPDLGAKSAVAVVDFQTPAVLSSQPSTMTDAQVPKGGTDTSPNGMANSSLFHPSPRSGEQNYDRLAAMPESTVIEESTPEQALRGLSASLVSNEEEAHQVPTQNLHTQGQSAANPQQLTQNSRGLSSENRENDSSANWMRNLLGRKSAPAMGQAPPNLTARPHHRSRKVTEDLNLQRAKTLPAQVNRNETDIEPPKGPESFARVITDLEGLLQQALEVAGHVNGRINEPGTSQNPALQNESSIRQSTNVRNYETSYESIDSSDENTSSDSPGLDEEQNRTTTPKQYADRSRGPITLVEPDEAHRYLSHFTNRRHATPYPSAWMDPSGMPAAAVEASERSPTGINVDAKRRSLYVPEPRFADRNPNSKASPLPMQITIQGDPADVQNVLLPPVGVKSSSVDTADWALKRQPTSAIVQEPGESGFQNALRKASTSQIPIDDSPGFILRERRPSKTPAPAEVANTSLHSDPKSFSSGDDKEPIAFFNERPASQRHKSGAARRKDALEIQSPRPWEDTLSPLPSDVGGRGPGSDPKSLDLKHRHHFSIREPKMFSLSHSHRRSPIARDWSTSKKRWVALVACINTALMGLIIGIYAGEVPAIQYNIVDEHHYTILGNVVLFIGLAITTSIFWPLPLLYGRKPFTLAALALLVPLQFPQAVAVSGFRTPYTPTYRVALLLSRAIAGLVMGFANINFIATLLDLFGASLQSINPHQEVVNANDVRRHGGGMGIWLGVWTWCFIGSIGLGFFIGAVIISGLAVDWGFWITIILTAFVLVLNVLVPEVRRSPYRRSVAEVRTPTELSRRVARGEVKMHLYSTGPKWWVEEVTAGTALCIRMLKQPGFLVLSTYIGWIYGQIVMVIVVR